MDRHIWTQSLTKSNCPAWPCPVCRRGTTRLAANSLKYEETVRSKRAHHDEGWDPQWIVYTFTAWAECGNPTCGQKFAIAGEGSVRPEYTGQNGDWDWEDYFKPLACFPMPDIIGMPAKCPDQVRKPLTDSFSVFWENPGACANQVRIALEALMDFLGIPIRRKAQNGKLMDLTLHGRIETYASKEPATGSQLMALKWVGNTGSHEGNVTKADLLDAFEILEHVLGEIVERRSDRVNELARKLTKRHAPKKKK